MHVLELWRYPIKSMQGERLDNTDVSQLGLSGDRSWALVDQTTGLTLTGRRVPELLLATALLTDGGAVVRLPTGQETNDDCELSRWLGREVRLVPATEDVFGTYEIASDAEDEDGSEWVRWSGAPGTFHDSTRTRVSIIGQDNVGDWSMRRFRPNVVVSGSTEDTLVGHRVQAGGTVVLDVVKQIDRCVMVTRPQPGGIERDLEVLRTINRDRNSLLGVAAMVLQQGHLTVGDRIDRID